MVRRYIILGIFAVVLCVVLLVSPLKPFTRAIFLFPSYVISATVDGVQGFFSFWLNAREVDAENKRLKEELKKLEVENMLCKVNLSDMERIAGYSGISPGFLLSKIIARDPTNWFKMVFVDSGKNNGVRKDMPVVLPCGLVGRVNEVDYEFSNVILVIDRSSNVSALVVQTREMGIVEGQGQNMLMKFFSKDINARPGDEVFTAGLGGIFPKGLKLGNITSIDTAGLVAKAEVKPAVDFNTLEEVFILLKR